MSSSSALGEMDSVTVKIQPDERKESDEEIKGCDQGRKEKSPALDLEGLAWSVEMYISVGKNSHLLRKRSSNKEKKIAA